MTKVLPREIYDFFDNEAGRSMIIKGHAGIGKTILSLTMLEEVSDIENSFYFSTRVSNKSLYSQFKWLKEKDMRKNLVDSSMEFLKSLYSPGELGRKAGKDDPDSPEHKVEKAKRVLNVLEDKSPDRFVPPEHVSRTYLGSLMGETDISELEDIYNRVDSRLPSSSLIIIDSLESLTERYSVDANSLIKVLQKDLVELSGTKLILVIESEDAKDWDYLVDGVLTLRKDEERGRRIRQMLLNKLRGVRIDRPVYLYTLNDGKFRYAPPFDPKIPVFRESHEPIPDGDGTPYWDDRVYSTGSKELDNILGGGFPHDSLVLLEFTHEVPLAGQMNLFGPVLENFLAQDRGVLFMPSGKDKNKLARKGGIFSEKMDRCLKIVDVEEVGRDDKRDVKHIFKESFKELKFNASQPLLTICDWVGMEHSIGQPSMGDVDRIRVSKEILEIMRDNSGLTIGVMGPGFSFADNARYVADIHIKVFTRYNSLMMYGEKPNTEIYNITVREGKHPTVNYVKQV